MTLSGQEAHCCGLRNFGRGRISCNPQYLDGPHGGGTREDLRDVTTLHVVVQRGQVPREIRAIVNGDGPVNGQVSGGSVDSVLIVGVMATERPSVKRHRDGKTD